MLSPSTNSSSNNKVHAGELNLSAQTSVNKALESNRNLAGNVSTFGTENVPATSGANSSWAEVLAEFIQAEILSAYGGSSIGQSATDAMQTMTNPGTAQASVSGVSSMDYWLSQIVSGLGAQSTADSSQSDGQSIADGLVTTGAPSPQSMAFAPQVSSAAGINSAVEQASATYGLPASLVRSVIQHESGFHSNAVSPVGEIGLMQLMPQTAQEMGVSNPYDPVQNVWGGTRYLANLVHQFHGDLRLAVAAYNAGPGAVLEHGGVPPYPETQAYVTKVLGGAGLNTDTHSAT